MLNHSLYRERSDAACQATSGGSGTSTDTDSFCHLDRPPECIITVAAARGSPQYPRIPSTRLWIHHAALDRRRGYQADRDPGSGHREMGRIDHELLAPRGSRR